MLASHLLYIDQNGLVGAARDTSSDRELQRGVIYRS